LFERFQEEGLTMSYTWADFELEYNRDKFLRLPRKERRELLASLPREERRELLASLPREERRELLASLPREERRELLASLPPGKRRELLASLPPEERLAGLSEEQIRQYLERITGSGTAEPRKSRRKR
jgi:Mg/Co/Ni transporter MgtE